MGVREKFNHYIGVENVLFGEFPYSFTAAIAAGTFGLQPVCPGGILVHDHQAGD
jgi:hypothetical protein